MYIPIQPAVPSKQAKELGEKIADVVRGELKQDRKLKDRDVLMALQVAKQSLRSDLSLKAASVQLVVLLVALLLTLMLGVAIFLLK